MNSNRSSDIWDKIYSLLHDFNFHLVVLLQKENNVILKYKITNSDKSKHFTFDSNIKLYRYLERYSRKIKLKRINER